MKAENEKYCINCGEIIDARAEVCPKCGVRQPTEYTETKTFHTEAMPRRGLNERWLITLLLCILPCIVGINGIHRFYTGKIGTGVLMLLTLGGCGIWTLIDIIMIATNQYKDDDGNIISYND